jgi:hypothetical protein
MIHVEHLDGCKVWASIGRGGEIALYPTCDAGHVIGDEDGEAALDRAMEVLVAAVGNARCELEDTPEVRTQVARLGGSGQGILIDWLEANDSVALAERKSIARGTDHACLIRYDGTDLCQWHARSASGYHHPHGRPMRIMGAP